MHYIGFEFDSDGVFTYFNDVFLSADFRISTSIIIPPDNQHEATQSPHILLRLTPGSWRSCNRRSMLPHMLRGMHSFGSYRIRRNRCGDGRGLCGHDSHWHCSIYCWMCPVVHVHLRQWAVVPLPVGVFALPVSIEDICKAKKNVLEWDTSYMPCQIASCLKCSLPDMLVVD